MGSSHSTSNCVNYLEQLQHYPAHMHPALLEMYQKGEDSCNYLQQLDGDFHFGGNYTDNAYLNTGAILGDSAGQIDIIGKNNVFNQGNSKASSGSTATMMVLLMWTGIHWPFSVLRIFKEYLILFWTKISNYLDFIKNICFYIQTQLIFIFY